MWVHVPIVTKYCLLYFLPSVLPSFLFFLPSILPSFLPSFLLFLLLTSFLPYFLLFLLLTSFLPFFPPSSSLPSFHSSFFPFYVPFLLLPSFPQSFVTTLPLSFLPSCSEGKYVHSYFLVGFNSERARMQPKGSQYLKVLPMYSGLPHSEQVSGF